MNHIYVISPQSSKSFHRIGSDGYNSSFGQSTRRSSKYIVQNSVPKYFIFNLVKS